MNSKEFMLEQIAKDRNIDAEFRGKMEGKTMKQHITADEVRIQELEEQLAKCEKMYAEKSIKYDEVCLQLASYEAEAELGRSVLKQNADEVAAIRKRASNEGYFYRYLIDCIDNKKNEPKMLKQRLLESDIFRLKLKGGVE